MKKLVLTSVLGFVFTLVGSAETKNNTKPVITPKKDSLSLEQKPDTSKNIQPKSNVFFPTPFMVFPALDTEFK